MTLRTVGIIGAGLVLAVVVVAAGAAAGIASLFGGPLFAGDVTPSAQAQAEIPASYLELFQAAAATCPGLPWSVLAGIGRVETDFGTDTQTSSAGAVGPMQFLPATFAAYDTPVPPGGVTPPSPYDPTDAVYAAARDLCANGAENGAELSAAVFAYNHSQTYATEVLDLAQTYGKTQAQTVAAGTAGGIAVDWALAQVGTPYIWGGETPGIGFDCSGLVQAAYKAAGIMLPRVAQDQYDATAKLGLGDPLQPGDLIFFGGGPTDITHVGIYIGNGQMVDAPHAGAFVRVEATPTVRGTKWGTDILVGVTDPAA